LVVEFKARYEKVRASRPASAADSATKKPAPPSSLGLPATYEARYRLNFALPFGSGSRLSSADEERLRSEKAVLALFVDFLQKRGLAKLRVAQRDRATLPIAAFRERILDAIRDNQVVVVSGSTGCGKSTQVPQYLMQSGYRNVVCTQPRRIAAVSLCRRVSRETLNEYGDSVGYHIRFTAARTRHTRIVFVTEGVLLRELVCRG
jgi:hypothetical protein